MTPEQYHALLRQDLAVFIRRCFATLWPSTDYLHNFHIDVIASHLEDVMRGRCKRLIINLPPRGLKSLCASVALPAFMLGYDSHAQIICASYGRDLSDKLSGDCRAIMRSEWYGRVFPTRLASGRPAIDRLETSAGGLRYATSVGGTITGRGADLIIIDDPLKPIEAISDVQRKSVNDWLDGTILSRLNDKSKGAIVIIMQRLHEDDLVGHVTAQGNWRVVSFPAIAEDREVHRIIRPLRSYTHVREAGEPLHPARESLDNYRELERAMGTWNFNTQYQQRPAPLGGGLFKSQWLRRFDLNDPPSFDSVIQSWDTAYKASEIHDWSVCTTWGVVGHGPSSRAYLLDVHRKRLEYPDLRRAVLAQADRFNATHVLIEDCASGTSLAQALKADGFWKVTPVKPIGDKTMRLLSATPYIEGGNVFIPSEAPWLADWRYELEVFPNGRFDDQVDSTSQAINWITSIKPGQGFLDLCMEELAQAQASDDD